MFHCLRENSFEGKEKLKEVVSLIFNHASLVDTNNKPTLLYCLLAVKKEVRFIISYQQEGAMREFSVCTFLRFDLLFHHSVK